MIDVYRPSFDGGGDICQAQLFLQNVAPVLVLEVQVQVIGVQVQAIGVLVSRKQWVYSWKILLRLL
ncbi:hypothetical protein BGZ97_005559, partial [Linnemannia gamsii]